MVSVVKIIFFFIEVHLKKYYMLCLYPVSVFLCPPVIALSFYLSPLPLLLVVAPSIC
ncbi:hypothetical protein NC652_020033 [Populus alba x Populus x berolinensis]|nr:hypothetical protein NC652_020033 [Populus alba x Populus x berolinensis]